MWAEEARSLAQVWLTHGQNGSSSRHDLVPVGHVERFVHVVGITRLKCSIKGNSSNYSFRVGHGGNRLV